MSASLAYVSGIHSDGRPAGLGKIMTNQRQGHTDSNPSTGTTQDIVAEIRHRSWARDEGFAVLWATQPEPQSPSNPGGLPLISLVPSPHCFSRFGRSGSLCARCQPGTQATAASWATQPKPPSRGPPFHVAPLGGGVSTPRNGPSAHRCPLLGPRKDEAGVRQGSWALGAASDAVRIVGKSAACCCLPVCLSIRPACHRLVGEV